MALCTAKSEAEPGSGGGVNAVDHRVKSKFQRVDASLLVHHSVTVKTGGHVLVLGGVGQHVTGNLLNGKLVKRHVGVERVDTPVSPRPDGAWPILFIAVRIRVTREVKPRLCPTLAVLWPIQQSINQSPISIGVLVLHKRMHLFRRGGQTDEIQ